MSPLPLPVRVAAGLVASAVEQARELPRLAVEFPVTAVSQALQVSMRMQQTVTSLAIKGDQVIGNLRPVEEEPAWATFDDEDDVPASYDGPSTVTELRPSARPESPVDTDTPDRAEPAAADLAEPNALPGYREMTIPQLRGRLRHLSVDDLRELLEWETTHENRPPFVTMLSNRITTVTET